MGGQHRIIVIGSGVSGLACARELVQRGHEVLVVEARSRVGGRLKGELLELGRANNNNTDGEATSHAVDLGGALIHGIDDNPIHSITTQMGVPLHEISDYCLLLDENGWPFDPKEDDKLSTLFNECLDTTFQRAAQDKSSTEGFGYLFDKVCQEKGVSTSNPLLQWHQANLELPTGAGFHDLGYTWNDDEPYGFSGAHAAVEPSWKFVMERLADGLDILYNSPVTQVQVVLPDGTSPTEFPTPPDEASGPVASEQQPTETAHEEEEAPPPKIVVRTEWRKAAPKAAASPKRTSRRIRGENVNVRRSSRSTKGMIQKLQIADHNSLCYDDTSKKHQRQKRKRQDNNGAAKADNEPPSSTVQVTLANGIVLEANAVICTLPLGVLKVPPKTPGHIRFVPPIPTAKRAAIDQLGCGLLNKCAISFPNAFWPDSEFLGLAGTQHSYLVLNVMKYTGKPILIFMYGGPFAKELESWTDSEIVEDCLALLKKICGKDVSTPVDYCISRWGQEQFSRMAFTYIPPGVDGHQQLAAAGEAIQDPALLQKPLVMFAGEHTTPYHPSTMHGAFLSGIREAYRYDLFVEPELNDHMQFDTDHKLYGHTFHTRRVYKSTNNDAKKKAAKQESAPAPSAAAASSSQIRSRRRRFAGMALRQKPKQVMEATPPPKKSRPMISGSLGSRRSQRSLSAKKPAESSESPGEKTETEIAQEKMQLINELEDRTLLRSLESYGRDCNLVRSKIVPVFGSTRKRSVEQIRNRWQQIAGRKRRSEIWKQWEAKQVPLLPQDSGVRSLATAMEPSKEDSDLRRSRRKAKTRVVSDF
jgi:monoamine oxidase